MNQASTPLSEARARFARLQPAIITIDGPGASGKSTVGYRLAQLINYLFFDTGVMYRALTWAAIARGVDVREEATVSQLAVTLEIDVAAPQPEVSDGRQNTVLVDGQDVTWQIRSPDVDQNVSVVSAYPAVRQALSAQQRRIGRRYGAGTADKAGVVMVGRDIGTVILPEAPLKIYMDATPEERAQRRFRELQARGRQISYEDILQDLVRRDRIDSERAHSPMRPADDAIVIDTSGLAPEAVVTRILALADHWLRGQ
jgi:cytidylate kinase